MKLNIDKVFIINLDNRSDKLNEIKPYLPFKYDDCMRFSAINGTQISAIDDEILELFSNNNYAWHAGTMGCSLSHYRIWQQIAIHSEWQNILILEDDAFFTVNKDEFNEIIDHIPEDYDLCYFGGNRNEIESVNINQHIAIPYKYSFGTSCYMINQQTAKKLILLYQSNANKDPIDIFLNSLTLTKYITQRSLIYSPADYKTDIQQNRNQIILPKIKILAENAHNRQLQLVDTLPSHCLPHNIYQIICNINKPNQQHHCDILIVKINTDSTANLNKVILNYNDIMDINNNYILYQTGINKFHDNLPLNAIIITTPIISCQKDNDQHNKNIYCDKLSGDLSDQITTLAKLYFNNKKFKIQYDSTNEFLDRYFYHLGSYMIFDQRQSNLPDFNLQKDNLNYLEFKKWLVQPKYLRDVAQKIHMLTAGRNKYYIALDAENIEQNTDYIKYAMKMIDTIDFGLIVFTADKNQQINLPMPKVYDTIYIEDKFVRMLVISDFPVKILSNSKLSYWSGLFSGQSHIIYAPETHREVGPVNWCYLGLNTQKYHISNEIWEINI